jgi:predicted porin
MNKKLGLAVAGALLAASASAQAGITIPAGDWTVDIGGVVNAYYTTTRHTGDAGEFSSWSGANGNGNKNAVNITTGLLPNYLSVSGKTRQNDLDVAFTISINPGASTSHSGIQTAQQENRQAFVTFGDASWGSIKLGKDLGIYASDAILNDMTLLGVGGGAGVLSAAGNTTTVGRIGSGFIYADWKAQVAYTSPVWNGFQFTAGVTQPWNATGSADVSSTSTGQGGATPAFEAKASYAWTGDVAGKVWMSAISQRIKDVVNADGDAAGNTRANGWDMGVNVNAGALGATAYYGSGKGIGHVFQFSNGLDATGKRRDSDNYYVQATYTIPAGTKLGVSYGESKLDGNSSEDLKDTTNKMWTVGAYHPITKNLNLVAEYSDTQTKTNYEAADDLKAKAKTVSLGAILFF